MLNYIRWDINPEIITVFGITLRYYGVLFVGGLILCGYILSKIFIKEQLSIEYLQKLALYTMIGIFAGARLGHCLLYEPEYYLARPIEMFFPIKPNLYGGGYRFIGYAGLASHGGAIGLIVAMIVYTIKNQRASYSYFRFNWNRRTVRWLFYSTRKPHEF